MKEAKQFHRVRFYPGKWSTFDAIEECKKPQPCFLCQYKHPICTEDGVVNKDQGSGERITLTGD